MVPRKSAHLLDRKAISRSQIASISARRARKSSTILALYHLGSLAPLGPADRQRMLDAPTLAERLTVFEGALDDAAAVVQFRSA